MEVPFIPVTRETFPHLIGGPHPILMVCASECNIHACAKMRSIVQQTCARLCQYQFEGNIILLDCAVDLFPAVADQLELTHFPTTFAVYRQQFLDSLKGMGNLTRHLPHQVMSYLLRVGGIIFVGHFWSQAPTQAPKPPPPPKTIKQHLCGIVATQNKQTQLSHVGFVFLKHPPILVVAIPRSQAKDSHLSA